MIVDSRACTKCAEIKPLTEFSKAPRGKYGRKASCKACDASRHVDTYVPKPGNEEAKRARYTKKQSTSKRCGKCDVIKDSTEFSVSRQGKYGPILKSVCRRCHTARQRAWAQLAPDGSITNERRLKLKSTYGISVEQYAALLIEQGGGCAACGSTKRVSRKGVELELPVDHCHETGRIRGILCNECNRVVGLLGDSVHSIQRAIDYLNGSSTKSADGGDQDCL